MDTCSTDWGDKDADKEEYEDGDNDIGKYTVAGIYTWIQCLYERVLSAIYM